MQNRTMNKGNRILKAAFVALASVGLVTADAVAQTTGGGPAPTTANGFRMYNSSTSNITLRTNPAATTTGTFLFPAPSEGIFTSDANGTITLRALNFGDLDLSQNAILVGNAAGEAAELASPGAPGGQVLQIDASGAPTWQTINLLPNGTTPNTTLAWDPTANGGSGAWVENTNLLANPTTGDVTISPATGTTTINSGDLVVPNISSTAGPLGATDEVLITDAAGNVTSTSPSNIVGAAELLEDYIYVGNSNDNPEGVAPGSNGQVLQINGTTPTWQSINLLPTGSVDHSTLVWDDASSMWVENTNVTMDDATGDITTSGDVTAVNATFSGSDINLTGTPTTAGPLTTENVLIVDPAGNVTETSPSNIVGAAELLEDYIYVGNSNDNPEGVAPGSNGQVLQINGTTPTWQSINLLPTGSVDHSTLVWDDASSMWVENTNVTMDDATGDITTSGDVNAVDGSFSGNVSGVNATFTGNDINLPNIPAAGTPLASDDRVLITDNAGNVEEVSVDDLFGSTTLSENAIWYGDNTDSPAELASSNTEGDVLTINASGTPTWSTPTGSIAAKGKVTGTGTWTYTVNPGVDPSGANTVIMVTMTSTAGLQVTHVVNNITATTFDVEFPINISGTETFHWTVIQ